MHHGMRRSHVGAGELVKHEKEKQKQNSTQDANATKPVEDDNVMIMTSQGSTGG